MEVTNIKPNVDLIALGSRSIYLVGTAHISHSSADLAEEVIREVKPHSVAVELCASRYESLKDPERWKNTDIVSVIRKGRAYVLMAQLALAAFQKKLGAQLHIKPGAEMLRACDTAEQIGAALTMADRDIKTTLKRTWASISLWTSVRLVSTMLVNLFGNQKIDLSEIERLKSADALEEMLGEFSEKLPQVRTALIDERDQYLSQKIKHSPGEKVVAIVGAGHVPGIKKWIEQDLDLAPLEIIPPKGKTALIVGWLMFIAVMGMVVWGFTQSGAMASWEMLKAWFWITGFSAAVGSALAMAHPLTVVCSFLVSPFTTLHPVLASGWFAGLIEAWLRRPRVSDFETIADDLTSFQRLLRNRISRILAVIIMTNLGGTIGSVIGTWTIANML